ncbi:hypothetical protein ACHAWX_005810 [Stephanocyclus meneghinianus]
MSTCCIVFRTLATLISGLLGSAAWFLSLFGGVYCKFLSTTVSTGTRPDDPFKLNFGLWYYQGYSVVANPDQIIVYELCRSYPDGVTIDSKWKSARAFSTLAIVVGGLVTLWALVATCSPTSKSTNRVGGILFLLCCLFQGLAFLIMSSNACNSTLIQDLDEITRFDIQVEDTCAMIAGANCTIAATVLWFCAAIPAFKIDIPQRGAAVTEKEKEKEAEADEQTLDPDGHDVVKEEAVEIAAGTEEIAVGTEKEAETA